MRKATHQLCRVLALWICANLLATNVLVVSAQSNNATTPEDSSCESLTLTLEEATISLPIPGNNAAAVQVTTRLFNGTYPGPTLRWQPGDCWIVTFTNALSNRTKTGLPFQNNVLSAPDETNLHFHGLHVSGELPSDDITLVLAPGEAYTYNIKLPAHHMPGTHWIHQHRHGSSGLHVGGGAVAALVVSDPAGYMPAALANAPELLFLAHPLDLPELRRVANTMEDRIFRADATAAGIDNNRNGNNNNRDDDDDDDSVIVTVNGQILPTFTVMAETWTRVRILWTAWRRGTLDWSLAEDTGNCQVHLLAKDGLYIRDFPRRITSILPLLTGARADVMLYCATPGQTHTITGPNGAPIARLMVVGETGDSTKDDDDASLPPWTPDWPVYLSDLRQSVASPGSSAGTRLDLRSINGQLYQHDAVLHHTYQGAVVERQLRLDNHPYHQHVYPFQIIQGFGANGRNDENAFYRVGDWHDVVQGRGIMRYQTTEFTGKIMVHCHRLKHEDEGMMAVEMVHERAEEQIEASSTPTSSAPSSSWPIQTAQPPFEPCRQSRQLQGSEAHWFGQPTH